MRSRVTPNVSPIWSSVFGMPSPSPKRIRMTPGLALGQGVEQALQLLLQHREAHRIRRHDRLGVLDEVAELAVAVLAERGVQRDRLAAVLLHLDDLLRGHVELAAQLLWRGLAAEVLQHLPLHAGELVDDLDHVHRDADGAGLVGHRAGDRLADPPRRIGRELEALGVVELLDRTDETEVALLDEVQELHAATGVALGERDHEAEVRAEQVALRTLAVLGDPLQLAAVGRPLLGVRHVRELLLREQAGLDAHRELDLLRGVEQRDLADLLQVVLDGVGGGAGDRGRVDRDLVLVVDQRQAQGAGRQLLVLAGGLVVVIVVGVGLLRLASATTSSTTTTSSTSTSATSASITSASSMSSTSMSSASTSISSISSPSAAGTAALVPRLAAALPRRSLR